MTLRTQDENEQFLAPQYTHLEAMKITMQQIIKFKSDKININTHKNLTLEVKFGYDRSSGHKMYNQANNLPTEGMILTIFCRVAIRSTNHSEILWEILLQTMSIHKHLNSCSEGKRILNMFHIEEEHKELKESSFLTMLKSKLLQQNFVCIGRRSIFGQV